MMSRLQSYGMVMAELRRSLLLACLLVEHRQSFRLHSHFRARKVCQSSPHVESSPRPRSFQPRVPLRCYATHVYASRSLLRLDTTAAELRRGVICAGHLGLKRGQSGLKATAMDRGARRQNGQLFTAPGQHGQSDDEGRR
jgi:hypothetical protein